VARPDSVSLEGALPCAGEEAACPAEEAGEVLPEEEQPTMDASNVATTIKQTTAFKLFFMIKTLLYMFVRQCYLNA
jgi:hypothetical protein